MIVMVQKKSYLSNFLGRSTYDYFCSHALLIAVIGTSILVVLYALSYFFHSGIISYLLNLTNGTSLLFIGYIIALIVLFDIEVNVEEPEKDYWGDIKKDIPKPFRYKLTIVWTFFLLTLGIIAIYYSNKYRKHYAFECETYLVDSKTGIYHLDWDIDCGLAEDTEGLEPMKGYQIDNTFRFCEGCEELLDEAEEEVGTIRARPE